MKKLTLTLIAATFVAPALAVEVRGTNALYGDFMPDCPGIEMAQPRVITKEYLRTPA